MENLYTYKIKKIEKVVDGDTVYATVSLGFHVTFYVKLRLSDVDTPELNSRDVVEREEAKWFKAMVENLLDAAFQFGPMYLISKKQGKYGRWIGDIVWTHTDGSQVSLVETVIATMKDRGLM